MSDGADEDSPGQKRALEDVLGEVLSFNYRSLRTFRDIFLRPGQVAETFASGDTDTYTPTMRVWFGVISWLFLLSVIWGGFGELILRTSDASGDVLSQFVVEGRRDMDAMTSAISTMAGLLYVPLNALLVLLGVHVLRAFNRSLSFIQTMQCYFVPVTALAVSSTIFVVASAFEPGALAIAPVVNYLVFFVIGFQVVHRVFAKSFASALGRSLVLTFIVLVLSTFATLMTFFISIIYALVQVPPNF